MLDDGVRLENAPFFGRNWVEVSAMTKSELLYFLKASAGMKHMFDNRMVSKYKLARELDMMGGILMYENSTRTRTSFEIGMKRLGMDVVGFSSTEGTSVQKGECLLDTVDMYDCYGVDALVLRHHLDGSAKAVAEHFMQQEGRVLPVFNAGDGKNEHPTQGLLDAFTIMQCCGRLDHLNMGIAIDPKYGRTTHSFPLLLSMFPGNTLHIFSHKDMRMPGHLIRHFRSRNLKVKEYFRDNEQLIAMLPKLNGLYMTRLQKERFEDEAEYFRARDMFRFFPWMFEKTRDDFGLFHPLPLNKEHPSIHPRAKRHPKYWAKRQAGNGPPTRAVEVAFSLGLWGWHFDGELYVPERPSEVFYEERAPGQPKPGRKMKRNGRKLRDIRPIENGTVVDHVEDNPYVIAKLVQLLGCDDKGNIYRSGVVEPHDRPGEKKGVLMIKDRYLDEAELRMVATIAPGATVNYISNRKVKRKLDLMLPDYVTGLPGMACTNTRCVTRPEYNEGIDAKVDVVDRDENLVKCHYCNNAMRSDELFLDGHRKAA